jgi:hypothetical protein
VLFKTSSEDLGSDVIPEDDEERGELYDDVDHPAAVSSPQRSQPIDDEIYEELPGTCAVAMLSFRPHVCCVGDLLSD